MLSPIAVRLLVWPPTPTVVRRKPVPGSNRLTIPERRSRTHRLPASKATSVAPLATATLWATVSVAGSIAEAGATDRIEHPYRPSARNYPARRDAKWDSGENPVGIRIDPDDVAGTPLGHPQRSEPGHHVARRGPQGDRRPDGAVGRGEQGDAITIERPPRPESVVSVGRHPRGSQNHDQGYGRHRDRDDGPATDTIPAAESRCAGRWRDDCWFVGDHPRICGRLVGWPRRHALSKVERGVLAEDRPLELVSARVRAQRPVGRPDGLVPVR